MALGRYLAMTAGEIQKADQLPPNTAWMACHFSPCSAGLSNIPISLPTGSLLILDDSAPIQGHDPARICMDLQKAIGKLECCGLLLDFQRPGNEETAALVRFLADALPCPMAVSEWYAKAGNTAVFLSPCPHHMPLEEHILPWAGRDIWLDMAPDAETITLTAAGATIASLSPGEQFEDGYQEEQLHCHYRAELLDTEARFTLWRTMEDLDALAVESEKLGIKALVGLYQELGIE